LRIGSTLNSGESTISRDTTGTHAKLLRCSCGDMLERRNVHRQIASLLIQLGNIRRLAYQHILTDL